MSYNGYKNYPTWCLSLWIDNDEGLYLQFREESSFGVSKLADLIRQEVESWVNEVGNVGFIVDVLVWTLDQIDWEEIAEHFVGESGDENGSSLELLDCWKD